MKPAMPRVFESMQGAAWLPRARRFAWLLLWTGAIALAARNCWALTSHMVGLHDSWRTSPGPLLDFRDTVVLPGRFLAAGGNPYDPATYLLAHPQAQEFDPYAPSWLLVGLSVGQLPYRAAATIYVVALACLECWMAATISRWAVPRWAAIATPILFGWENLWLFTRVMQPSVVSVAGILMACRWLFREQARHGWVAAVGIALSLVKPQFGIPLCVLAIAAGRWRVVARGVGLQAVASLGPLLACVHASGGISEFVAALRRDLAYAASNRTMTGLGSTSYRVDLAGMIARGTHHELAGWLQVTVAAAVLLTAAIAVARRPDPDLFPVIAIPATLLCIVHSDYDIAAMLVALAGATAVLRRTRGEVAAAAALMAAAPVFHLHKVSMVLLGWSFYAREFFDVLCLTVSGCLGVLLAMRGPLHRVRSQGSDGASPRRPQLPADEDA